MPRCAETTWRRLLLHFSTQQGPALLSHEVVLWFLRVELKLEFGFLLDGKQKCDSVLNKTLLLAPPWRRGPVGISVSALISTATDPGGVTLTPSHDPLWHQADKTLPAQHQLRRHFTAVIYQNIKRINTLCPVNGKFWLCYIYLTKKRHKNMIKCLKY